MSSWDWAGLSQNHPDRVKREASLHCLLGHALRPGQGLVLSFTGKEHRTKKGREAIIYSFFIYVCPYLIS